jgi:structure-specific endonuclease subunit SLX1
MSAEVWFVYVLTSTVAKRTYVGIAQDPEVRLAEHNGERSGGAKATRGWRPWVIGRIYGPIRSKGEALQLEYRIKQEEGSARLLVEWEPTCE